MPDSRSLRRRRRRRASQRPSRRLVVGLRRGQHRQTLALPHPGRTVWRERDAACSGRRPREEKGVLLWNECLRAVSGVLPWSGPTGHGSPALAARSMPASQTQKATDRNNTLTISTLMLPSTAAVLHRLTLLHSISGGRRPVARDLPGATRSYGIGSMRRDGVTCPRPKCVRQARGGSRFPRAKAALGLPPSRTAGHSRWCSRNARPSL